MPMITTTPPRRRPRTYVLKATRAELAMLADALDSHAYWQLSEPEDRNDGYTRATTPDVKRAQRLESRIAEALERGR